MADRMEYKGITLDIPYLEKNKNCLISSRKGTGIDELKGLSITKPFLQNPALMPQA
jgi:ferrous iron transport protein B